jgi:hypothetical protein
VHERVEEESVARRVDSNKERDHQRDIDLHVREHVDLQRVSADEREQDGGERSRQHFGGVVRRVNRRRRHARHAQCAVELGAALE